MNVPVAGALMMREFGLSQVEMGRIFSAFLLGYALFQIPGGMLADRWGARRVLMLAAWWWVLGRANGFVVASIGLGSAIAPPLLSATMVDWGWRAAMRNWPAFAG